MDVLVSEVGPRDGLQSIKRAMPTAVKHKWIGALAAAGLKEIEVASFVPPRLLPQMADAAEIVHLAVHGVDRGSDFGALAGKLRQGYVDLGEPRGQLGSKALAHAGETFRKNIALHIALP